MTTIQYKAIGPDQLTTIAEKLSCLFGKGDTIFLIGDLGAGKSTLARAMIRAMAADPELEVPSPTFPILITYETPRSPIAHFDLYRLGDISEVEELGLYDELDHTLTLIEWPGQLGEDHQINNRVEISLEEADNGESRFLNIQAFGTAASKLQRLKLISTFLNDAGWGEASWAFLQGDASTRSYLRLNRQDEKALLMNAPIQPDGPPIKDGKPYSQIAHLAEDMTSFVAVANALKHADLTAPEIHSFDIPNGLLLIGDLGDEQYYNLITTHKATQQELYEPAIDALVHLRKYKPEPMPVGEKIYNLPAYDDEALAIESELVIDWYWPHVKQQTINDEARAEFKTIWSVLFASLKPNIHHWVLRDYHSPNLIHMPNENNIKSVGIIDFQDALSGHAAYDVVSLCQDARYTVQPELEQSLLNRYCNAAAQTDQSFDETDFRRAYAILGAQRACKLLGIFVRLCVRDGKPHYLAHLPRTWDYLERNLKHPHLNDIFNWYETHFPAALRASYFETE